MKAKEFPATFGQSADAEGNVYVQWHRRDNAGRVEIFRLSGNEVQTDFVKGTQTAIHLPGLLSFASVSIRGDDVYRVRPEQGLGLCRHSRGQEQPQVLCPAPSICPAVITREHAIYGGLDGKLYVVPLSGGETTSFTDCVWRFDYRASGRGRRTSLCAVRRWLFVCLRRRWQSSPANE